MTLILTLLFAFSFYRRLSDHNVAKLQAALSAKRVN